MLCILWFSFRQWTSQVEDLSCEAKSESEWNLYDHLDLVSRGQYIQYMWNQQTNIFHRDSHLIRWVLTIEFDMLNRGHILIRDQSWSKFTRIWWLNRSGTILRNIWADWSSHASHEIFISPGSLKRPSIEKSMKLCHNLIQQKLNCFHLCLKTHLNYFHSRILQNYCRISQDWLIGCWLSIKIHPVSTQDIQSLPLHIKIYVKYLSKVC